MAYTNLVSSSDSVIILVTDGARPDTLADAIERGELPAFKRLCDEGEIHTVTTVFPSVTGPAYTPFVLGKHPGDVGLPGIRWYDRSRQVCSWPGYARSYVGIEMRDLDTDLDPQSPTMFELVPESLGALSVIQRGLSVDQQMHGSLFLLQAGMTHFRGKVQGWLDIDRDIGDRTVQAIHEQRPRFVFAAFTGTDKASHAEGHNAPIVLDALKIVDQVAGQIRLNAERGGYWETMHLWIVSDHGHSPVTRHEDLAGLIADLGYRVLAHPNVFTHHPEVAVMVSGNAMAHIYLDLEDRTRQFWHSLQTRWQSLVATLLDRDSVDLLVLPTSATSCEIHTRTRGSATLEWTSTTYSYRPSNGDPLTIGTHVDINADVAYDVTHTSDYPDALVQLARLCMSSRSGDIILSATRHWDYRARYEPIPHVSSHGALHREHMLAPMITNRPTRNHPRRTVDVMASAAKILGVNVQDLDGTSFI